MNELQLLEKMAEINKKLIKDYYDILESYKIDFNTKNHKNIEDMYNISTTIQNLKNKLEKITEKIQIKENEV